MKYRHSMLLLALSLPICVIIRTIQLIFTIDSATGFVKQQYSEISVLITFVVCAAVAAVSVLAATTDEIKHNKVSLRPVAAIACALVGGMFIYETVSSLASLGTGEWHDILLILLNLLSAFTFIAYGLRNVYEYKFPSAMLIAPVIYYVVKLINLFVSTSALALVTENIFLLFTNSALLWFMFEFASFENGIGDIAKRPKKLFACGIAAIMLCAVTALPKIVLVIFQKVEVTRGDISSALLMIAMALFILVYVIYSFGQDSDKAQKPASKHSA